MDMETTTNPTTVVWQLVVNRPKAEQLFVFDYLVKHSTKVIVNQHDADDTIKRTHCHYSIVNIDCSKQALTKFLNKNEITGSDQFGILTVHPETKTPYKEDLLDIYVIKGDITNVSNHGITIDEVKALAERWIFFKEGKNPSDQKKKTKSEHDSEWARILDTFLKEMNPNWALFDIRKWLIRYHWKNDGRMPHATSYKRNACSLYYKLVEANPRLRAECTALDEIMEWNY